MQKINVLNSIISTTGNIFSTDGRQRIDLKKPIKDAISGYDLAKLKYSMELCLNKDKTLLRTKELLEEGIVPVLLYFIMEEK